MAMAHHFEPNDRDPTFGSLDLGSSSFASAISRLAPRAEAEARFFAHIALSNLPPHHNSFTPEESLEKARERYTDFLTNIFEPEHQPEGTVELNIVASYLSRERDIVLASVRDRSTGDLLLPRPDDILKLDGDRLVANARRFEEDTFCGILFDITPQESNYVVVATPVVLPHLMRREAIRFHNGDQDSLVKELLSRFARQELGSPPQFQTALVADDESKEGLVLLLTDERGRKYGTKIINPGGGLLHEVEFFIPLDSAITPPSRGAQRAVDLSEAFKRRHLRLSYNRLDSDRLPEKVRAEVESSIRNAFKSNWSRSWRITIHNAALATDPERHYHVFASVDDRNGMRILPAPEGSASVESRKLGGLLVHIDESPRDGLISRLKVAVGMSPGVELSSRIEAWMFHPRVLAAEIERLTSHSRQSIFDDVCRSLIARDLEKRGKTEALGEISFGPFCAWSHSASKIPLRAIVAGHRHGKHLISFGFDERNGLLHPDHDIRVEGFFPA